MSKYDYRYASILYFAIFFAIIGCAKSPGGSSEELIKINPPLFGGATYRAFTTPTSIFTLDATCDTRSIGIRYSYDQSTWTTFPGGCPTNAQISLNVNVFSELDVYFQSQTPGGFTESSHAYIRLLLPPTSPSFQIANSGKMDNDLASSSQNVLESTFTRETLTNGLIDLKTGIIDYIYE